MVFVMKTSQSLFHDESNDIVFEPSVNDDSVIHISKELNCTRFIAVVTTYEIQ